MSERAAIDRGWYYIREPDDGEHVGSVRTLLTPQGRVLTRRLHGVPGRICVVDQTGSNLAPATLLRAAAAAGEALTEQPDAGITVLLKPEGADQVLDGRVLVLNI